MAPRIGRKSDTSLKVDEARQNSCAVSEKMISESMKQKEEAVTSLV